MPRSATSSVRSELPASEGSDRKGHTGTGEVAGADHDELDQVVGSVRPARPDCGVRHGWVCRRRLQLCTPTYARGPWGMHGMALGARVTHLWLSF